MRTASERAGAIETRTRALRKRKADRRRALVTGLAALACLAANTALALDMPELTARQRGPAVGSGGAAAGVFAAGGASGYVLIGLLSFVLGCSVTILCYRLRGRTREERDDRDH